jgi:hypothetical protein
LIISPLHGHGISQDANIHFSMVLMSGTSFRRWRPSMTQPHFEGVWGWHSHSWNGDLGVLRDSQKFRTRLQGSKHLALRCFLYRWKDLEASMSKMASHEPFGHLQHKLHAKERSGIKLAIWLPTTKSWESTRPWCVQVECDTPLESSQREVQVFVKPHPNLKSEQGVMSYQSPGSPNRDSFETISRLPFGSPETKSRLDVAPVEWCRVYYMGEGGGFPRVRAVMSQVSPELPMACLSTKGALECELTNLLVGLMQVQVSE